MNNDHNTAATSQHTVTQADDKKTLLVFTIGLTPQVVTETLYAIAKSKQKSATEAKTDELLHWPDRIELLTTTKGAEFARINLLVQNKLAKLCDELALPLPEFDESKIHVIPDSSGAPVDDARTKDDAEALANFITQFIAKRCHDETWRIHASLAGGRKTMTYFLGEALSLFGRPGDRLSHVLVSEQYENIPEFYYPTNEIVEHRFYGQLDASKAQVILCDIPFFRKRASLPAKVVTELQDYSYAKMVAIAQLISNPENLNIAFVFNKQDPRVEIRENGKTHFTVSFAGKRLVFAIYATFTALNEDSKEILTLTEFLNAKTFNLELLKQLNRFLYATQKGPFDLGLLDYSVSNGRLTYEEHQTQALGTQKTFIGQLLSAGAIEGKDPQDDESKVQNDEFKALTEISYFPNGQSTRAVMGLTDAYLTNAKQGFKKQLRDNLPLSVYELITLKAGNRKTKHPDISSQESNFNIPQSCFSYE